MLCQETNRLFTLSMFIELFILYRFVDKNSHTNEIRISFQLLDVKAPFFDKLGVRSLNVIIFVLCVVHTGCMWLVLFEA